MNALSDCSMKTLPTYLMCLLVAGMLAVVFHPYSAHGMVVDNFDGPAKTDWQDFSFGIGGSKQENGQLVFQIPAAGQAVFAAATKTTRTYRLEPGRTVDFQVDMVSGNSKDSFAILSWIPVSQQVSSLAGYSLAKSSTDVLITKGINKYFYNENPEPALKNENVTLALSLTAQGSNVVIRARILDKDNANAVLFDQTFVDTPASDVFSDGTDTPAAPFLGEGHFVLMEYQDYAAGGPEVYEVVFDNAEAFALENVLLDDFNDNQKTDWKDFSFGPGLGRSLEENGQLRFELPAAGQAIFAAATKTSRNLELGDGERLVLSVDMVSGNSKDSFAILSWIPVKESVASLAGYSLAKSSTDVLIAKGINKYFFNQNVDPPIKNENVTLVLSLTGAGANVVINARILDKDNANAVLFDKTFVDTPAADALEDGTDSPAAPYLGVGQFVLMEYEDFEAGGPEVYEVIFDNAYVSAAPPRANAQPVISEVSPEEFANFSSATAFRFKVRDDRPLAASNIVVILNGQSFGTANGLEMSGPSTNLSLNLPGLAPNRNYVAEIRIQDADGEVVNSSFYFDTFQTGSLVIEAEDYNYGGGQFFDNPKLNSEWFGPQGDGYLGQVGVPEIDYHDERTSPGNYPYRAEDLVASKRSLDAGRAKFQAAGGSEGGYYDYDIGEIRAGEYLNYTRTFPAGVYEVYLRESLFNVAQAQATLERVTSNPAEPNQTTTPLGSFLGFSSGSKFRNAPLTDGLGRSNLLIRLSGRTTLRLRQGSSDPGDGNIYQNYLVFVARPEAGTLPAAVTEVWPAPEASLDSVSPYLSAWIANRDTSVDPASIQLRFNGQPVTPTLQTNANGVGLRYDIAALPPSGSRNTVQLIYTDSGRQTQTNEWSFRLTYRSLDPAARLAGPGLQRGFKVRVVQAPSGSNLPNSLARADEQLRENSPIPAFYSTNVVIELINLTQNDLPSADGYFEDANTIPGLTFENGTDDIAADIRTYLELAQGVYRLGVRCDDGYKIIAPRGFDLASTPALAFHNGGPADETIEVAVPQAGLYPFQLVWYERGGGAHLEWFSVDPTTGDRILINDSAHPKAIKAYATVELPPEINLQSAGSILGPFQTVPGAVLNASQSTISVPRDGSVRFYRLLLSGASASGTPMRILKVEVTAEGVVLTYGRGN